MRLIALLSGGKDSLYAAIYAQYVLGHEIVAAVNLYPTGPERPPEAVAGTDLVAWTDEVDSAMFQSVGAHVVGAAYADCLPSSIRWYRAAFEALEFHTDHGLRYRLAPHASGLETPADEVATLHRVVGALLDNFEVQGLARPEGLLSGAILSDYQRLRIEHVASQHQLVSVAPLWRRDARELFDSICALGIEAIIVKVASLGLDMAHLGKSLYQVREHLMQLETRYGVHCLGEGGEYETLVLDSPWFRQRLVIDASSPVDHGSGSAYLRIERFHCEEKPAAMRADQQAQFSDWMQRERARPLWVFPLPLNGISFRKSIPTVLAPAGDANASAAECTPRSPMFQVRYRERLWHLSDDHRFYVAVCWVESSADVATHPTDPRCAVLAPPGEAARQTELLLLHLRQRWPDAACRPFQCLLFLANMQDFAAVNAVYAHYFAAEDAPPVRCCVQVASLPHPTSLVQLEVFAESVDLHGKGIHVQSLSLWAPACIGPYSQARIQHQGTTLYLSGMLALFPGTGEIPEGLSLPAQIEACLWNANRVVEALDDRGMKRPWQCRLCIAWYKAGSRDSAETHGRLIHEMLHKRLPRAQRFVLGVPQLPRNALVELQFVYERREAEFHGTHCPVIPQIAHDFLSWDTEDFEGAPQKLDASPGSSFHVCIPVLIPHSVYGSACTRLRCYLPPGKAPDKPSAL